MRESTQRAEVDNDPLTASVDVVGFHVLIRLLLQSATQSPRGTIQKRPRGRPPKGSIAPPKPPKNPLGRPRITEEEKARRLQFKEEQKLIRKAEKRLRQEEQQRLEMQARLSARAERLRRSEARKALEPPVYVPLPRTLPKRPAPSVFVDRAPTPQVAPTRPTKKTAVCPMSELGQRAWDYLQEAKRLWISRLCGYDEDKCNELVSMVMIKVIENEHTYTEQGHFRAWIARIAMNEHYSRHRRIKGEISMPTNEEGDQIEFPVAANQDGAMNVRDVIKTLGLLSGEHREVLELVAMGYSYEEMASKMAVTVGTVKSRLWRARANMVRLLSEDALPQGPCDVV